MDTRSSRCLVLPAIKKNAVIPDQLVKKLAGVTLIQRALDTALQVASPADVHVVTDSEEIRLICQRNGVACFFDRSYVVSGPDIVDALRSVLVRLAGRYEHLVIYRASAPLLTAGDIEDAYALFLREKSDCLVTVKSVRQRLWLEKGRDIDALLFRGDAQEACVETRGLFMLRREALEGLGKGAFPGGTERDGSDEGGAGPGRSLRITPYFLNDRALEINSHQDWWLCEKILQSRHVVFVVAGYPAIGMGHVYRTLMLAHEITGHRISFVCTRDSELAARSITEREYRTRMQGDEPLQDTVLKLKPDLVVNDILNTDAAYVGCLKSAGVPVVNFEDQGPGAALADLVVNALYDASTPDERCLYGPDYFCLRDEFLQARRNEFRDPPRRLLITFGGTDAPNFTRASLEALFPLCVAAGLAVDVVAGPGYAYRDELEEVIAGLRAARPGVRLDFSNATNIMSSRMEDCDLAVCSAGRTVYELAHMRIPAVVLSQNPREDMHSFARPANGFFYLGVMRPFCAHSVTEAVRSLLRARERRELYERMRRYDFSENKVRVVGRMLALLETDNGRARVGCSGTERVGPRARAAARGTGAQSATAARAGARCAGAGRAVRNE